ncbi:MAG: putative DNA binding domain-containing protein [Saprospiraceae bacterium]|nr:putative DNA binding domain-containing protein [Saprospiraceae bacterium]
MSLANDKNIWKLVRENDIFEDLNDQELTQLFAIADRKNYNKNQRVFSIDQKARFFYLVERGTFILSLPGKRYKTMQQGTLFGEIGIINENVRTGSIRAMDEASLIAFNGIDLYDESIIPASIALKITRSLAKKVTNYLRTREHISTKELIENGENDFVEFKASLRWNADKQQKDRLVEHAVIKTLAAFMNTKGGTLLIGVQDDGTVVGIGQDRFDNYDKMLLHLTKIIKERIGTLFIEFLKFDVETIEEEYVLRIDCEAASTPAYVRERNEEIFYVRTGPSTTHLKTSRVFDYIRRRFYSGGIN